MHSFSLQLWPSLRSFYELAYKVTQPGGWRQLMDLETAYPSNCFSSSMSSHTIRNIVKWKRNRER